MCTFCTVQLCVCYIVCEMYYVYCCIQGDLDDTALNMPLLVGGPETEEEEAVSVRSMQCYIVCEYIAGYRVIQKIHQQTHPFLYVDLRQRKKKRK